MSQKRATPPEPTPLERRLRRLTSAANYLQITPRQLRRKIAEGEIPAYRLPGNSRVLLIDLNDVDSRLIPVVGR